MTTTGEALRAKGVRDVQAADDAINRQHRHAIDKTIVRLAKRGVPFSAEDVRQALPKSCDPHSPNLLPSCFGLARQRGVIHRVGDTRTTRRSRHSSRLALWLGGPEPTT